MNKVLGLFLIMGGFFVVMMGMEVESSNNGEGGGIHYAIAVAAILCGIWIMFPERSK